MSEYTRRDFLKLGVASSCLLAVGGMSEAFEVWETGKEVSRTTGKPRKAIPSTCLGCFARCGIFGYVEYGRLVKIGGNKAHPNSRGRLCAKGQAGVNALYDPDRILYPLKRQGARGSHNWKRISWDEAFTEITNKAKAIQDRGRPEELVFYSERDITTPNLTRRFGHAFGTPNAFSLAYLGGPNKHLAHRLTWGADLDVNDVAYTAYILNFGCNPYEAHILRTSFAQRIAEARAERMWDGRVHNRAKIVTFDPRMSQTAGRSDEWFPIRPGTDGLVALAMANVIMSKGLYDRDFLTNWTNYPPTALAQHLSRYNLEWAEKESGVKASEIERIALEFASTKPATTIASGGLNKHQNGVYNERCVALLNAITGNIDIKGGFCLPRQLELKEPVPIPEPPRQTSLLGEPTFAFHYPEPTGKLFPQLKNEKQKIAMLVTYAANPAYSQPNYHSVIQILKSERSIPFYVAIDSYMTESAVLADIILPASTYLERFELETPPTFEFIPFISLRQPTIKPRGESRSFTEIILDFAHHLGGNLQRYFDFGSDQEYWEKQLLPLRKFSTDDGLEYLKEHGVWYEPDTRPDYQSFKIRGFNTPSGKFEIYSSALKQKGFEPLPVYVPIPEHLRLRENELILITFQWNVHTHGNTSNCMYLSEIVHDNPVWINTETARARGIRNGDRVKVTTEVGTLFTRAMVTEGIHPKVVAISDNCGHWEFGRVAQAQHFKSDDPNTGLIWWEKEGKGVHPYAIIPSLSDPAGGGLGWMDTVVMVSRI